MIPDGERDNVEATVRALAAEDVVSDHRRIDSGRVEANRMIQQYRAQGNSRAANFLEACRDAAAHRLNRRDAAEADKGDEYERMKHRLENAWRAGQP